MIVSAFQRYPALSSSVFSLPVLFLENFVLPETDVVKCMKARIESYPAKNCSKSTHSRELSVYLYLIIAVSIAKHFNPGESYYV